MNLTFKTPAKINLGLHILHKREDGYHELETLLQMVSLYDEITLESRPSGIELECGAPGIPTDSTNLAVQAAQLLRNAFPDRVSGVRIRLVKHIPSGAGLGGGSGNAAGVLMGLNRLWDLRLSRRDLVPLAARLGSDVPFFLTAPCAIGRGRGEILDPIQTTVKFKVLLVFPGFPIATPWVYRSLNLKLTKRENNISILKKFLAESKIACLGSRLYNDLEAVVCQRYPEIQAIKNDLLAQRANGVLLSGSGSAVFGIFDNPEQAKLAYANFNPRGGGLFLTETITSYSEFLPDEMLNYP
ncbi:MAG: 4-(cytidine 5'-diphospho)-2-C-methyl-D-erythritol kinase [Nitrospinaceae bacterium]